MHLMYNKNTRVIHICPFNKDKCPFPVKMVIMPLFFEMMVKVDENCFLTNFLGQN